MAKSKLKAPKKCVQSFTFCGYPIKPGDIYGIDKIGPYVTRPIMYKNCMAFKRPTVYNGVTMWIDRKASRETSETVRYILAHFTMLPPPITTAHGKAAAAKARAERDAKTHAAWHAEQNSVIQKRGMKFKARTRGNCKEYHDATRAVYGDTVEMNGRSVTVTDRIGFYLDGGTIR